MTQGENETGFQIYLRQISKFPLLTAEQEVELARRIKLGDQQARAEMVRSNLKLVVRIARDYANLGLPLLDLISEGNIGLMKAVERFDPEKGGKLSTYAAWWIKESIRRALANQAKTIRLPVHLVDKIGKIRRVSLRITEELGREPTDEELAEEIGLSVLKIKELRNVAVRPASLDRPIQGDESLPFRDILGDDESENPFEQLRDKDMLEEVGELLDLLDDREREIINSRFGLGGKRPETLGEVGEKFGVTRERVRQLQKVALNKLRNALARKERSRANGSRHEARLTSQQGPPSMESSLHERVGHPKISFRVCR
jgi:RNA polymerase primary sigma factor